MQIEFINKNLKDIDADAEIILVDKKDTNHEFLKSDYNELNQLGFFEEKSELIFLTSVRKLFIKCDGFSKEEMRNGTAKGFKALKGYLFKSIKMASYADACFEGSCAALCEGFLLGSYEFDRYKTKKNSYEITNVIFSAENYFSNELKPVADEINKRLIKANKVCNAVNLTRDTANLAPDDATPKYLAELAANIAEENGLECNIYDEQYLSQQKMGAFAAVARASYHQPRLVHLVYKPENSKAKVVLVGKGLTYDSGGLSLKPSDYMVTMKADKAGASAVLGIMSVVSKLGLNIEVHGVIGACENMIGGNAYKPDDILVAKNGKTIEVRNTDAEGRLVLADCLCYIQDYFKEKNSEFDYIVDFATLTGACVVALGEYTTGVMGHNEKLKDMIVDCGDKSGDLMAKLPFNTHLRKLIKSEIADISNCSSSRYGGAITAAMFLDEFIYDENKQKWAHLDIAGPAYVEKSWGYNPHGASGTPVRSIARWLENI